VSECCHPCKESWTFPAKVENRPGLNRIGYRIGTYADFRKELLRRLDCNPVLAGWTHREPDDPGIALLEGAAILGDILTFYQELYANEAFLRTAQWRESIAELVRLTGYRLSPGLGGKARFAFAAAGTEPLVIPKGFPVQADLQEGVAPSDFELNAALTAYPELNQFALRAPCSGDDLPVDSQTTEFYVESSDAAWNAEMLKKDDRLLLGMEWEDSRLRMADVAIVESVHMWQGVARIKIRSGLKDLEATPWVRAYKLGRTFSHFGHNAAWKKVNVTTSAGETTVSYSDVDFNRCLDSDTADLSPQLTDTEIALDREVHDVAPGSRVICQGPFSYFDRIAHDQAAPVGFTLVRTVRKAVKAGLRWGDMTGTATILSVDVSLQPPPTFGAEETMRNAFGGGALSPADANNQERKYNRVDVRSLQIHEVVGAGLALRAWPKPVSESKGKLFCFHGSEAAARALAARPLLVKIGEAVLETSSQTVSAMETIFGRLTSCWQIGLADELDYSGFMREQPAAQVFGNIGDATQGKTQAEAVLGHGDNRQAFQTFKLPKAPVTYLNAAAVTPPEKPEVEIFVNGLRWECVPSLFGRGPEERVYIVREDAEGASWVQFGDDKTGQRLPAGVNNVTARYRTGIAASGPLKPEAKPQPGASLGKLESIRMLLPAGYGSQPESGEHARDTAPGQCQGLGRLVSLQDYEKEAQALGSVLKAKAAWDLSGNSAAIRIAVLLQSGRKIDEVRNLLSGYDLRRGPARYPIIPVAGAFHYVYLALTLAHDPAWTDDAMALEIQKALGLGHDGGVFNLGNRTFKQDEYAGRIEGVLQNVPGAVWVKVTAFCSLGEAPEGGPAAIPVPAAEAVTREDRVACGDFQILALDEKHLKISCKTA